MNTERTQVERRFRFWWLLASTGGWAVIGATLGALIGASIGIAQWPILRREVAWSGGWVMASTVGGVVGFVVALAVVLEFDLMMMADAPVGAVAGASLGIAQWLVLRRQVARAGLWVLASAVGPAVIYFVFFIVMKLVLGRFVGDVMPGYVERGAMAGSALLAVVGYGAITGAVLVMLLRQPATEEPGLQQDAA